MSGGVGVSVLASSTCWSVFVVGVKFGAADCTSCSLSHTGSITETCAAAEGSWKSWGVPLPPPLPSHKSLNSIFSHDSIGHVWRCCSWLFWWILGVLTALWHNELQHNKHMAIAWPVQLLFTSVSCRRKKITYWRCVITRKGAYGSFLILFFPQHEFPGAGNNSNSMFSFFLYSLLYSCCCISLHPSETAGLEWVRIKL